VTDAPAGDALRRFERRMRWRLDLRVAFRRSVQSIPAAVQIVIGVVVSYSIAHFALGHATPLLSITIVISSLGLTRDARPRRVLETAVGILIGIILSELILILVGHGVWQIGLVLLVTLVVARFASPNAAFAVAAATQSMLVMILPVPAGGPFVRSIDALIGGVVALLMTALIPRDPRRVALRDARSLISTLSQALNSLVESLVENNLPAASLAVDRLRRTQSMIDDWSTSVDSAISIARISPFLRRHLPELRRQANLLQGMDLAARHLRVIGRRVFFLLRDGGGRPELAELLGSVDSALELLGESLDAPERVGEASAILREIAPTLDPATLVPNAPVTESVIVLLVRPLVVDLLVTTGSTADEARALLPVV
jgi:uncharacterized membrane protein YgaE (UPF0421/DUF939 family)